MVIRRMVGKGRNEVAESQQFRDRGGVLVRVVNGEAAPISVGEAYAFFHCSQDMVAVEREIPLIRITAHTPTDFELYLRERPFEADSALSLPTIVGESPYKDLRYMFVAQFPRATNQQTAEELSGIMQRAYQSKLYEWGEGFTKIIVYKDPISKKYIFAE